MEDILEKLDGFRDAVKRKTGQDLVTLRIQELVLVKVLISTYGKSEFRMVIAEYNLGLAYLEYDCIEQAIEHISVALHKNDKLTLTNQLPKANFYHIYMQNTLARCLIKKGSYDDAAELLKEAIQNQKKVSKTLLNDDEQPYNTQTMILMSQALYKLNELQQAMEAITDCIKNVEERKGACEELAMAMIQKATIEAATDNFQDAITSQETAINILIDVNYSKPEEVAEMYATLAKYYENQDKIENALGCMQKVKTLNQELYSDEDKKTIKARRKIATLYLKSEKYKEAVSQLSQILQIQEKLFGESSLQCARTLKLLGTIYISVELGDANKYLKRSLNIFQSHGNKKQVIELKNKLKMVNQGGLISASNLDLKVITEHDAS